ncbi:hypothetical protein BOX15_Mlig000087g1 [Macrostomum lignano]|uniref:RING-type E3 ubiquitin transferase n=1 Tax=Macrostomum lignano TaxID=282301 RepID=A0A267ER25_9PLAT|nr:hypothetical protein BOX15_Mlig000087g1 [Macrostomum lignano]
MSTNIELRDADSALDYLASQVGGPSSQFLSAGRPLCGLRVHGVAGVTHISELLSRSHPTEVRAILVHYLGLLAAGTFTAPMSALSPLTPHLLESGDSGLVTVLWQELPADVRAEVFSRLFTDLHTLMKRQRLTETFYKAVLQMIIELVELQIDGVRVFARFLLQMENWNYNTEVPVLFERLSFLPAFLCLSPFASESFEVAEELFPVVDNLSPEEVLMSHRVIHTALDVARDRQYQLLYSLLREPQCRPEVLRLLWRCCRLGSSRGQMQFDESSALSEGFLLNLQATLCKLAAKIPLDKVDRAFLLRPDCPFPIKDDDARLMANAGEVAAWRGELGTEAASFNTQGFFLAAYAHHIGLIATLRKHKRRLRNLREAERILDSGEQAQNADRIRTFLNSQKRAKLCDQAAIYHESLLRDAMFYYDQLADWLLSLLQYGEPQQCKELRSLPEFFLEDMCELLVLVIEFQPGYFKQTPVPRCFRLVIAALSHPYPLVRNPHLVSKLVEILFYLDPTVQPRMEAQFQDLVMQQWSLDGLVTSLLQFYVEVESTGSSSEFYDKFTIRYHLATIFHSLWATHLHREQFRRQSQNPVFVRFVNVLINDATYLLDESLGCLKRIREIQDLADSGFQGCTAEQQGELKQELNNNERQVKSYLTLSLKTVEMFNYLTQELPRAFMNGELVERLATMLNYNLKQLCGSKCNTLKVRSPDKYGWEPRSMLSNFITIYLNLAAQPEFQEAIVNDERSYSESLLPQAIERIRRAGIRSEMDLQVLERLRKRTDEIANARRQVDLDYDNAPDEFMDEMMFTLMSDPVELPTGQILDRATIRRHLLNSATNPYSKMPMSESDLKELPELRNRIAAWKAERDAERRGGARGEPMQH